jgi:hypothetical protein
MRHLTRIFNYYEMDKINNQNLIDCILNSLLNSRLQVY